MKLSKFTIFSGVFVLFSQFGTVGVYGILMGIAYDHHLPLDQLYKYFGFIMNAILIVFIAFSALFLLLMLGMVWRVWTQPREANGRHQEAADPLPE